MYFERREHNTWASAEHKPPHDFPEEAVFKPCSVKCLVLVLAE